MNGPTTYVGVSMPVDEEKEDESVDEEKDDEDHEEATNQRNLKSLCGLVNSSQKCNFR